MTEPEWQALWLSLRLGSITLLSLLPMGLLVGRWLARTSCRAKVWIEALIVLPLVLPPTVLGYYLLISVGSGSRIGQWLQQHTGLSLSFSFTGLVVASIVFNIPFMIQPVQRAFEAISPRLIEAATVNGLSAWSTFWRIEMPLAWPGVLSAMLLTFVHTLGEFGVVLMVGGNIPGQTQTMAIVIYDRVQTFDLQAAHRLSLILLVLCMVCIVASLRAAGRFGSLGRRKDRPL